MIIISHRGNINGADPQTENTPGQIKKALDLGFFVEVDVWGSSSRLWLGHDKPGEHTIGLSPRIYYHCKNLQAAVLLYSEEVEYFIHDSDKYVLTSTGKLWTYPGNELSYISIAVLPETCEGWDIKNAFGVCTDYPLNY